jgi:ElaB/YqjD/DUF883 family membrane-anchored ribosome-binding protein
MASTPTAGVVDVEAAQTDQQQNGGAGDQAREKATEVADQAREKAGEAADQARGRLREEVEQRSTKLGEQVGSTASDLRTVGEELRKQGKDTPAKMADQAADRSERVGRYLSQSDAERILNDVEDFARRRPWAVVAGGIALGVAASRFLKASSSERYRSRHAGTAGATPNAQLGSFPPPQPPAIERPPAGVASGAPTPGGFTPAA